MQKLFAGESGENFFVFSRKLLRLKYFQLFSLIHTKKQGKGYHFIRVVEKPHFLLFFNICFQCETSLRFTKIVVSFFIIKQIIRNIIWNLCT